MNIKLTLKNKIYAFFLIKQFKAVERIKIAKEIDIFCMITPSVSPNTNTCPDNKFHIIKMQFTINHYVLLVPSVT